MLLFLDDKKSARCCERRSKIRFSGVRGPDRMSLRCLLRHMVSPADASVFHASLRSASLMVKAGTTPARVNISLFSQRNRQFRIHIINFSKSAL